MNFAEKSPAGSLTIIAAVIAMLCKIVGVTMSDAETSELEELIRTLWPVLLAIGADLGSAWSRLRASNFNKELMHSGTFWFAVASAFLTLVATFGLDVTGFRSVLSKSMDAAPAIASLVATLVVIYGRWKASQKITVR
jgi:hypothetical protein